MPIPYEPMLCAPQPRFDYLDKFTDDKWIAEIKYDGERIIAERKAGKVRLWTRRKIEVSEKFPEVVNALIKTMPAMDWIVDGELTVKGGFEKLLTRNCQNPRTIETLSRTLPATYNIFDLLKVGEFLMVRNAPLDDRRNILEPMFTPNDNVKLAHSVKGSKARSLFEKVVSAGGEGIVVKHLKTLYVPGHRHSEWMKFKKVETVDVQVVGATKSDALAFGSLVLVKDGEYFGKVGTGFTDKQRSEIFRVLRENPDTDDFARWKVPEPVKREMCRMCRPLEAEIKILERHKGGRGRPRHPVWVRWKTSYKTPTRKEM